MENVSSSLIGQTEWVIPISALWKFKCAPHLHIWKNIHPYLEEPEASLVWRAGKVVAEDEDNPDQESEDGGANQRPVEFLQNIYEEVSLWTRMYLYFDIWNTNEIQRLFLLLDI